MQDANHWFETIVVANEGKFMTAIPIIFAMFLSICGDLRSDTALPDKVGLLPVFFVPRGEDPPTPEEKLLLMKHLRWCQNRYRELLRGDTFRLAALTPEVYRGEQDLEFYQKQPEGSAPNFVGELLKSNNLNRYNCPFIFFVVVMSPKSDWIGGGARPLNGGNNWGGGIVEVTSNGLNQCPNFQSTARHEIGHSLGLPHVDVYGQSMESSRSMMSYNPAHHTNGFQDSPTPGEFSPEDLRALSMNKRCLETFRFDPAVEIPPGESISPQVVCLGPMDIVGQPSYDVNRTASTGDDRQSQAQTTVKKENKNADRPRCRKISCRMGIICRRMRIRCS
jgi:hypothetical protein